MISWRRFLSELQKLNVTELYTFCFQVHETEVLVCVSPEETVSQFDNEELVVGEVVFDNPGLRQ